MRLSGPFLYSGSGSDTRRIRVRCSRVEGFLPGVPLRAAAGLPRRRFAAQRLNLRREGCKRTVLGLASPPIQALPDLFAPENFQRLPAEDPEA